MSSGCTPPAATAASTGDVIAANNAYNNAFAQYNNDFDYTISAYTSPIANINVFRFSSAIGKNLYINGGTAVINDSSANAKTGLTLYVGAQIGKNMSPTTPTDTFYSGNIGEIIIFNKYINDDERKDIEQYLGKKWGVVVS